MRRWDRKDWERVTSGLTDIDARLPLTLYYAKTYTLTELLNSFKTININQFLWSRVGVRSLEKPAFVTELEIA